MPHRPSSSLLLMETPFASGVGTRHVLIVDDQRSVATTLEYVFADRGYRVVVAESGPAALLLAREQHFDAALVDVHMPGMDGMQVCRRLIGQCAETHRPIALWLMTAAYTAELARIAVEAGAIGLLKKPFDSVALCRQIEEGAHCAILPFESNSPHAPGSHAEITHAAG